MFAALVRGTSKVTNLSRGADVCTTREVFSKLGTVFHTEGEALLIDGGGIESFFTDNSRLYCGNSGTTLRLLLGILAGSRVSCELYGDESLNRRPVKRVIDPLTLMGGDLHSVDGSDRPPVRVRGASLHGIDYESPVASAQVKSAVLLAAINASGVTHYREPAKSRDHTERFLEWQGYPIAVAGTEITMAPGGILTPFEYKVPGDISTAAFYIVAALLTAGSELLLQNVLLNPTRTGALEILEKMGAEVKYENCQVRSGEPVGDVLVNHSPLIGRDATGIDTARFVDEVPILAVAAMFAQGTTVFHNIGELRVKESDRAQGIVDVLACYGCKSEIQGDKLVIEGGVDARQKAPSHQNDHRLAMMIEIIELVRRGQVSGEYRNTIAISAPEFYDNLKRIIH